MKNPKLKIIVLMVVSFFIFGSFTQISAFNGVNEKWLKLEGLELAKGKDISVTDRVGTIFAGQIMYKKSKIGYWSAVLSHTGTENIEVCNGEGQIVSMILILNFYWGDRLVLEMYGNNGSQPGVHWDYNYAGRPCRLGGLGCQSCGDPNLKLEECYNNGSSDVAKVEPVELVEKTGSTIKINSAVLVNGRLCHYYPIIPRVSAWLLIEF